MNVVESIKVNWKSAGESEDSVFYRPAKKGDWRPKEYYPTGVKELDEAVRRLGVQVVYEADDAPGFGPFKDKIFMLPPEAFTSPEYYIHAMAHELVHWTAGATDKPSITSKRISRLHREIKDYPEEELVAEIGCAILLDRFGLYNENQKGAVEGYVKNFILHAGEIEILPGFGFPMLDDAGRERVFDRAAAYAQKAVDYILGT